MQSSIDSVYYRTLLQALDDPTTDLEDCEWVMPHEVKWKPFDLAPEDFLRFAEADLQSSVPHRHINALANTKRALDCQLDCILRALGLLEASRSQRWGFPRKLEAVQAIGLLTPRILRKINHTRNVLEHEFEQPTLDAVEDALDTASIFVAYTDSLFRVFPARLSWNVGKRLRDGSEFELFTEYSEKYRTGEITESFYEWVGQSFVNMEFDLQNKTLNVESFLDGDHRTATVQPTDEEFLELFRCFRRATPFAS